MQELIKALRCSTRPPSECEDCTKCKYRELEPIDERIPVAADVQIEGVKCWQSCDYDQIALDAAYKLEELSKRNEPIMGAREVALDKCPACGSVSAVYQPKFCHHCGQALKWR